MTSASIQFQGTWGMRLTRRLCYIFKKPLPANPGGLTLDGRSGYIGQGRECQAKRLQKGIEMFILERRKFWSLLLIACMFAFQAGTVNADMVSTDQALSPDKIRTDREKVRVFMNRTDAQEKLQALGVQADVAKARVDALTDAQVEAIAGRIDALPAGGDLSRNDLIIILLIAILLAIAL